MQCKKSENGIIFLHKIAKGSSYGSFGIDVAKLADLPSEVISRAKKILKTLDVVSKKHERQLFQAAKRMENDDSDYVRHLKQELENKNQILKSLEEINLDELTPRQAFDSCVNASFMYRRYC